MTTKKQGRNMQVHGYVGNVWAAKPHGKELRHLQVIATQSQSCIPNNRGIYVMEFFLGTRSWQFIVLVLDSNMQQDPYWVAKRSNEEPYHLHCLFTVSPHHLARAHGYHQDQSRTPLLSLGKVSGARSCRQTYSALLAVNPQFSLHPKNKLALANGTHGNRRSLGQDGVC